MLKMFSTQLTGLFNRIQEKQEFAIEDCSRLLAQAAAGDGLIYIYATSEMAAVTTEALYGKEPLTSGALFSSVDMIKEADRVLVVTRFSNDEEAVEIGRNLRERDISFAAISTVVENGEEDLTSLAEVHIDLGLKKGLLPDEVGNRFGYPSSMVALFVYHGIKFTVDEILAEYEEDDQS